MSQKFDLLTQIFEKITFTGENRLNFWLKKILLAKCSKCVEEVLTFRIVQTFFWMAISLFHWHKRGLLITSKTKTSKNGKYFCIRIGPEIHHLCTDQNASKFHYPSKCVLLFTLWQIHLGVMLGATLLLRFFLIQINTLFNSHMINK